MKDYQQMEVGEKRWMGKMNEMGDDKGL